MGPLTIILGSPLKGKNPTGKIRLVTPHGHVVSIDEKDIVHQGNADSGGDLKRFAVSSDAPVLLETTAGKIADPTGPRVHMHSQKDKYMDDQLVMKSFMDGGFSLPKWWDNNLK